MRSLSFLLMPSLAAGAAYCPGNAQDMQHEGFGGSAIFQNGGWTLGGNSRVSSKTAWNLLGGSIEWDMDVSQVADGMNTNLYTSSPDRPNCGAACYCDIQRTSTNPSCMELDLVENNGKCYLATTTHTHAVDGFPNNRNCDRWGCGSHMALPGNQVHMRADFGMDGSVTVYVDGVVNNNYSPVPSAESNQVVVDTMKSIGAVIESSQWFGWVPDADKCPSGSAGGLAGSVFSVSNVRVTGTVIQGPTPTLCSGQSPPTGTPPTPATPPQPTPATPPQVPANCPVHTPSTCGCSWTQNGANCGVDDASDCWCQCCCAHNGGTCKSLGTVPAPTPATPPATPTPPAPVPVPVPVPVGVDCVARRVCTTSTCTKECGGGRQTESCVCEVITPASGNGKTCDQVCSAGSPTESDCNTQACPQPVDPCAGVTCSAEECKTSQCVQGSCQATNMANGAACGSAGSCNSECQSEQCQNGGCACVDFADNTRCGSAGGSCQSGVCQLPSPPAPVPPSPSTPDTQPQCLGAPAGRGQSCTPTPKGSCNGVVGCCEAGLHCCGGLWWATCQDTCSGDAEVSVQFAAAQEEAEAKSTSDKLLTAVASAVGGTLCGGLMVFAALRANGWGRTNAGGSVPVVEEGEEMGVSTSGKESQGRSTSRAKSSYAPRYEEADI